MKYLTSDELVATLDVWPPVSLPVRIAQAGGVDLRIQDILVTSTAYILIPEATEEDSPTVSAGKLDVVEIDAGWQIIFSTHEASPTAVGQPLDDLFMAEAVVSRIYARYTEFLNAFFAPVGAVDQFVDSLSPSPNADDQ